MRPARPTGAGWVVVGAAAAILLVLIIAPLAVVFVAAFSKGVPWFLATVTSSDTISAIGLTMLVVLIAVPLNTVFGVAAAWTLTKFRIRGRAVLAGLVELPLAVSPVVGGMLFVFLFGSRGWFGFLPNVLGIKVIYGPLGIALATLFVTLPYVARELVPVMRSLGPDDENAARALGANGWQMFRRVTLPNIRWGLAYGVLACAGRAVGEFGAVSVVSGHIRGETTTLPLEVELLYNEYNQAGAFAVAALLSSFTLFALIARKVLQWKERRIH